MKKTGYKARCLVDHKQYDLVGGVFLEDLDGSLRALIRRDYPKAANQDFICNEHLVIYRLRRMDQMIAHDRSLITVASLLTQGVPQLKDHMRIAKENGVTKTEMVELITHLAFYAGWPKAWSAFGYAKEIYK